MHYPTNEINFTTINGRVRQLTEYNTIITWYDAHSRVRIVPTLKSRAKYWLHEKAAPIRHYGRLLRYTKYYSL